MEDERTPDQAPEETGLRLAASEPPAPARLGLVKVTDAGRALLLRDELGGEYTLEITPQLRTSVSMAPGAPGAQPHGGTPRRSETKMTSSLRPRDIQNRIRSGESPESVAEAAGTTVEAIMPYVAPVVAEREHVASTAQRASLRRGPGEPPTTPPLNRILGAAVTAHLDSIGAKADRDIVWDAYRRDTGRWVLTATFDTPQRTGTAHFTYDAPGNYALTDDDDARWLIGDLAVQAPPAPEPLDDLQQIRQRRQAAASVADLPLGGAADAPADQSQLAFDEPLRPTAPAEPDTAEPAAAEMPQEAARESAEEADSRHRRPAPKKRGRASVPSWDEIMFGPTGD